MRTHTDIELVIADDDPIVRRALSNLLSRVPGIRPVAIFEDGDLAVQHAQRGGRGEVYLLDLNMPRLGGWAATLQLKDFRPELRVVILTASASESTANAVRLSGADAFVMKTAKPKEIVSAIRDDDLSESSEELTQGKPNLNERELAVLELLCEGKSNAIIAQQLNLSESRVKAHIGNAMTKLGAESRLQAALNALKMNVCQL